MGVFLNGRRLAKVGARSPGSLSIDVFLRGRPSGSSVALHVHGLEEDSGVRWGRNWEWDATTLKVGDQVRIELASARGADRGTAVRVPSASLDRVDEIEDQLEWLRAALKENRYREQAKQRSEIEAKRPPPRRYPTGRLVDVRP